MPRILAVLAGVATFAAIACGGVQAQAVTAAQNDLNTLNYALLLERLESEFYKAGQAKFTKDDFVRAGYTELDYSYFGLIAGHEAAHVTFLSSDAVLGTNAKPACTYKLGNSLDTVASYIATAAVLEGVGVGAYDGAIFSITDPGTQTAAATIATIEARHSAYLNQLNKKVPAVNGYNGGDKDTGALDMPLTPSAVADTAKPFIDSCPFDVATILPQVRPGGVTATSNFASAKPSNANPLSGTAYTLAQYNNDNTALNYALVLEHLEADFYKTQQAKFTRAQFQTYFSNIPSSGLDGGAVYDNLDLVAAHEKAHVDFLTGALNTRASGTAYAVCTYDWSSVDTIAKYIATSVTLESTGVQAYDGAVNAFTDTALQQAAATVATIEARHTSYLNLVARLTGTTTAFPFPGTDGATSVDTATPPTDILAAVAGLKVQTCPFTPSVPVQANKAGVTSSSTGTCVGDNCNSGAIAMPSVFLAAAMMAAGVAMIR